MFWWIQPHISWSTVSSSSASKNYIRCNQEQEIKVQLLWCNDQPCSNCWAIYHHEPWLCWKSWTTRKPEGIIQVSFFINPLTGIIPNLRLIVFLSSHTCVFVDIKTVQCTVFFKYKAIFPSNAFQVKMSASKGSYNLKTTI